MLQEARDTQLDDARAPQGSGNLGDEAADMAGDLRDEVESRADRWTRDLGRRGSVLARALGSASATLRDEGDDRMAELADQAAEQVERMAGYLEQEDPRGLMDDLEALGRSNPAAFLGTAFAAGILGGRLFRATSPETGNGSGASRTSATPPTSTSPFTAPSATPTTDAHTDRGVVQ